MFELFALFLIGAAIFVTLALVIGLIKLAFKLLLLPFVVLGWVVKGLLGLVLLIVILPLLAVALPVVLAVAVPVLIVAALVALPLFLLGALFFGAVSAVC